MFYHAILYTICMENNIKKTNLTHARTCVYNIHYHMVWSVKYRRKVLTLEIEHYLQELFQDIAEDKGFLVSMVEVGEQDHVHVFASAHPKVSPYKNQTTKKRLVQAQSMYYLLNLDLP